MKKDCTMYKVHDCDNYAIDEDGLYFFPRN